MEKKDSITAILYDDVESGGQTKHIFSGLTGVHGRIVEVNKAVLANSLSSLVSDIHEIVKQLPATADMSELETISVAVQVGANGGVAMVLSANTEVSNTITLTFRLKADDKHDK